MMVELQFQFTDYYEAAITKFYTRKERDLEASNQKDYSALMSVLVQRYFKDKKSTLTNRRTIEGELEMIHREIGSMKNLLEKQMDK